MFFLIDSIFFALERLWQHRVLVFWALVGLCAATTLALSLPLYVDAVNTNLLTASLSNPPYAFRFRYLGAWKGPITAEDVKSADVAVSQAFTTTMQLPVAQQVRYISSGAWQVRRANNRPLDAFKLGALEGADAQYIIIGGEWPAEPVKDALPVMIPERMMYAMGVQVGDQLTITPPRAQPVKLYVAAMWRPLNANDPRWIFPPKYFDEVLITSRDYLYQAMEGVAKPVEETAWWLIFDGSGVKTADVSVILTRVTDGQRDVNAVLPDMRLDVSPVEGLTAFNRSVQQLTQQLVIMVLPVGGLVLYFVSMVAGLLVSRQLGEDVTLRSRGMSRGAILLVHLLMWLTLAGAAFGIGIVAAPYVVQLVGWTTSFLRLDQSIPRLTIVFTPQAIAAGVLTALIAASSGLLIAWRTSRQTITSFTQQAARGSRAWWQRIYLDVMLLVPAVYVFYTLSQQGGLAAQAEDPFSDPIVFMGPTLFSLGATLLFLRLWPFLLRTAGRFVAVGSGISLLMALRELTRSIGRYRGALLMMCFTLSLTGFTASMASTLDRSLVDSINYKIGADSVLITSAEAVTDAGAVDANTGQVNRTLTGYNTLPAIRLLEIPEITHVSRMGAYSARLVIGSQRLDGTVVGVDRGALAAIARFRQDYAPEPLADLLNKLAGNRTGVILSRAALEKYKLKLNQEITYQVQAVDNEWRSAKVPIVGVIDYFPTQDPRDKWFLITNIEPVWETVGTQLPHDIWLTVKSGSDMAAVQDKVRELGYPVTQWLDPESALVAAQTAPARRGVLGFLSVGFVASIALTLVGNIIQIAASFRSQAVQLGTLRAMGLGSMAVGAYLILSQGLAVGGGILGGTVIGALTTTLYLPLLDFSGGLPPYLVRVAWNEIALVYIIFAGVLALVTLLTTFILGRERLFTVVKLGESA
jgi:putative ABC transport system permease protein